MSTSAINPVGQVVTHNFVVWFKKNPALQISQAVLTEQLSQLSGQAQWSGSGEAKQLA